MGLRSRYSWWGVGVGIAGLLCTAPVGSAQALMAMTGPHVVQADSQAVPQTEPLITVVLANVTVGDALEVIAKQAGLHVIYSSNKTMLNTRKSVKLDHVSVSDALAQVLAGTGYKAVISSDRTVLIQDAKAVPAKAATGTVSGQILDSASSKGIAGATVTVQGAKLSALTGADGAFALRDVPLGKQLLTVKMFGYKPASRDVTVLEGERTAIHIVLSNTTTILSGVVTTATGLQQKLAVGSDITTINVDSVMKTAPITSVTDLLENRVPGLTVVHTDGVPGDPSRLRLRGESSILESNNPIVVVDGIRVYYPDNNTSPNANLLNTGTNQVPSMAHQSPLDQIDPNTIATIEVLKGPSASALYGSDAANGVIVITTKKGQPGTTHWSVSADQGVSYLPGSYPEESYGWGHLLSSTQNGLGVGAALYGTCWGTGSIGVTNSGGWYPCLIDSTHTFQALNESRFSPLGTGSQSSLSTTVSGGSQALTYSFSGTVRNTQGFVQMSPYLVQQYDSVMGAAPPSWMRHPDDYKYWSASGQITAAVGASASVSVNSLLSSSTQVRSDLDVTAVNELMQTYIDPTTGQNAYGSPGGLGTGYLHKISSEQPNLLTNADLHWQVRPWLPLTLQAGLNRNEGIDIMSLANGYPNSLIQNGDTTGLYSIAQRRTDLVTLNANTTIPITLQHGIGLQLSAGTNFVDQSTIQQLLSTTSLPAGVSVPTSFLASATTAALTDTASATYGWFFEPNLKIGNTYLNPGIRFDGGTAPGNNAGLTALPKLNASYIAVDHNEMTAGSRWSTFLTLLRLRGALGVAGVQPAPGQNLRLYASQLVSTNGGLTNINADLLSTLGNTTLRPERGHELELGFDAAFWENHLSLTATYYDKLRTDAIESVPIAPSVAGDGLATNVSQLFLNIGNIRNTGLELTGTAIVLDTRIAQWTLNGSLSTNTNRVLALTNQYKDLASCSQQYYLVTSCIRAGYPLGAIFVPRVLGYDDINQDGVIEPNEVLYSDSAQYLGSQNPRYTTSFSTTVSLWQGRVSVNVSGDYQNGLTQYNSFSAYSRESELASSTVPLTEKQSLEAAATFYNSAAFYQTVNTLRLDALSLNYLLPISIAHTFRAQQVAVALQGSNLYLRSNYKGKDPNINAFSSGNSVADTGQLPEPRTWQLAVRITQ